MKFFSSTRKTTREILKCSKYNFNVYHIIKLTFHLYFHDLEFYLSTFIFEFDLGNYIISRAGHAMLGHHMNPSNHKILLHTPTWFSAWYFGMFCETLPRIGVGF